MDNFAQENKKNEVAGDIQFEEVFDLEEIQRKLQESIENDDPSEDSGERIDPNLLFAPKPKKEVEQITAPVAKPQVAPESTSKKYVIYIDSNNVDYMEELTSDDRRAVINSILKEQKEISAEKKKQRAKAKFITHLILACATFIISFPIMFVGVNKALEATIVNYQLSKRNFTKLYKEQGKIKMQDASANKY